jgi:hypothetical protein
MGWEGKLEMGWGREQLELGWEGEFKDVGCARYVGGENVQSVREG